MNPRAWHIDGPPRKLFIYLTDVCDMDGLSAYQQNVFNSCNNHISSVTPVALLKMHKKCFVRKFIDPCEIDIYTCPGGTSFIADQRYIHCGLPQVLGRHRIVLVV